ncbi:MAG: hypothetical protein JNK05_34685 [Myxococcales bacterium]|nr:hypothetical protein [Myxococcales bacterium]
MLIVDLAANERVERVISAHRREPVVIRVRGASAVRVFDDECVVTEQRANAQEDEVSITVDPQRLARWTRSIELAVQVKRAGVAHPRSDGATSTPWTDIATLRIRPWGAKVVRNTAIVLGGLSALVWLTAIPSAASQERLAWDLASGLLGLVLIVWAMVAKRVTAPGPALWGALAVVLVDVVSWHNTSATLNVGGPFEREGRIVRAGWSRDIFGSAGFRPYWYDGTYFFDHGLLSGGKSCRSLLLQKHSRWWWRALARPTHVLVESDRYASIPRRFVERVAGRRSNDHAVICGGEADCCIDFAATRRGELTFEISRSALPTSSSEHIAPTITVLRGRGDVGAVLGAGEFATVQVIGTDIPWTTLRWTRGDSRLEWSRPAGRGAENVDLAVPVGASMRERGTLEIEIDGSSARASSECALLPNRVRVIRVAPGAIDSLTWGPSRARVDPTFGVAVVCDHDGSGQNQLHRVALNGSDMLDGVRWSSRWSRFELPLGTIGPRSVFVAREGPWTDAFATCSAPLGHERALFAARIDRALPRLRDVYAVGDPQPRWSAWSSMESDMAFLCGDRTRMTRQSLFARIGDPTALQRVAVVLRESASGELVLEPARNRARRLANASR